MEQKPPQTMRFTWKTVIGMGVITTVAIIIAAMLANAFDASNPSLWTAIGAGIGGGLGVMVMSRLSNR